jgi:hypothetical protein
MLLRNRVPGIESHPLTDRPNPPYEHLAASAISVLRWLASHRIDYVLVGPVARAARGEKGARGPVAIVPAPYGRNLDRLARAVTGARARLRSDEAVAPRITAEKLVRGERWELRCGAFDLDIEGRPAGVPRYQELLADDVIVEVAAPEDIEHYDHLRRTGSAPEITVTRAVRQDADAPARGHRNA